MMMKSWLSPKTKVKRSSIERYGLFALKPFLKGEIVTIKGGHIVDRKTLKRFESVIGDSELQIADDFFFAPLRKKEVRNVMMFLNHSCNPNVGVMGNIIFVAMRNIGEREELTIDYTMIDDVSYRMKCCCGAKNCRGVITGKDWKLPELQRKYRGYFSTFLERKIQSNRKPG